MTDDTEPKTIGRPSGYTDEIAEKNPRSDQRGRDVDQDLPRGGHAAAELFDSIEVCLSPNATLRQRELMKPLIPPPPNEVAVLPPPPPPPLEGRDTHGRFAVGNPGKPRGARSRIAAEIDRLLEEGAEDAFQTIMHAARCGNVAAAQWMIDRVAPARKGRPISLENFPPINGAADFAPALSAIASSVANGDLSVEEAALAARVLREFLEIIETAHRLRATP
jgi:hypothetical protein